MDPEKASNLIDEAKRFVNENKWDLATIILLTLIADMTDYIIELEKTPVKNPVK